jgi:hypothetical protein
MGSAHKSVSVLRGLPPHRIAKYHRSKGESLETEVYFPTEARHAGGLIMLELLIENPWLIVVCLSLLIPILAIVFGTVTGHMTRVRKAEIEASLKMEMIQRGMSAEEIKMVVEATPRKGCKHDAAAQREWS